MQRLLHRIWKAAATATILLRSPFSLLVVCALALLKAGRAFLRSYSLSLSLYYYYYYYSLLLASPLSLYYQPLYTTSLSLLLFTTSLSLLLASLYYY